MATVHRQRLSMVGDWYEYNMNARKFSWIIFRFPLHWERENEKHTFHIFLLNYSFSFVPVNVDRSPSMHRGPKFISKWMNICALICVHSIFSDSFSLYDRFDRKVDSSTCMWLIDGDVRSTSVPCINFVTLTRKIIHSKIIICI